MISTIYITERKTGEVRLFEYDLPEYDGETSTYLWEEGNYACDCNRHLFFRRAKGENEDEDVPCGDTEYFVKIKVDGEVIYEDYQKDQLS